MSLLGEGTELNGDGTELNGEGTELNGEGTELNVEATELNGEGTELNGEATELKGEGTELNGEGTELNVEATELNGEGTELNGEATELNGEGTELNGEGTELNGEGPKQPCLAKMEIRSAVDNMGAKTVCCHQSTKFAGCKGFCCNKLFVLQLLCIFSSRRHDPFGFLRSTPLVYNPTPPQFIPPACSTINHFNHPL